MHEREDWPDAPKVTEVSGSQFNWFSGLSERVTIPTKPFKKSTVIVETAVAPSTAAVAAVAETEKSGAGVNTKAALEVRTSGPLTSELVPVIVTQYRPAIEDLHGSVAFSDDATELGTMLPHVNPEGNGLSSRLMVPLNP